MFAFECNGSWVSNLCSLAGWFEYYLAGGKPWTWLRKIGYLIADFPRVKYSKTHLFLPRVYSLEPFTRYLHSNQLGLVARKPVYGGSDKATLKPVCSASKSS